MINLYNMIQNLQSDIERRDEFINKLMKGYENLNQQYNEFGHKFKTS